MEAVLPTAQLQFLECARALAHNKKKRTSADLVRPQVNTISETDWNGSIQIYFVWKWEERGEIFYFSYVRWVNIKDNILCNDWPLRRLMMFNVYSFVLNTTKTAWAQTLKSRLFIYCSPRAPCQQMKYDSTIVFPMTRSHWNVLKCNDEYVMPVLL